MVGGWQRKSDVSVFMTRPVFPPRVCVLAFHFLCVFFFLYEAACVFRTQEELRVREEDQQTITVEVELKRHDSEPTISVPQPSPEIRYSNNTRINTMSTQVILKLRLKI